MKMLRSSLLILAVLSPSILNAAMLRFDVSATDVMIGQTVGMLPGSYFVLDTSVPNTSAMSNVSSFADSIVSGEITTHDPFNGTMLNIIDDTNSGTITATNNLSGETNWFVPVMEGDNPSTMELNFSDSIGDLMNGLLDDAGFYNTNFLDGLVRVENVPFAGTVEIAFNGFNVTDITPPAPVPVPPAFLLMASSLIAFFMRHKLTLSKNNDALAAT